MIRPNPTQPRHNIDEAELAELTDSVRAHGVLQPLLLRPAPPGFELVAGERRWRAALAAGLERVPALVREADGGQQLAWALIENLQRQGLNPLDAAEAIRHLAEEEGLSHEEIAGRLGRSRSAVTNTLRLLQLRAAAKAAVRDALISEGHARALLSAPPERQDELLQRCIAEGWNVRQVEWAAMAPARPAATSKPSADVARMEKELEGSLGTAVRVQGSMSRGWLRLRYSSPEVLHALYERLSNPGRPSQ
jgi:ParB family chromosome partitioning protein